VGKLDVGEVDVFSGAIAVVIEIKESVCCGIDAHIASFQLVTNIDFARLDIVKSIRDFELGDCGDFGLEGWLGDHGLEAVSATGKE
jgi:hypothetical protein